MNENINKIRISELPIVSSITPAQTIVPISTGSPLLTKGIFINDLIKDTQSLTSKANLSGGNTFFGLQILNNGLTVNPISNSAFGPVSLTKLTMDNSGDGLWSGGTQIMTTTQLAYLSGLNSNIQSQLNDKAGVNNPSFNGGLNLNGLMNIDDAINDRAIIINAGAGLNSFSISASSTDPTQFKVTSKNGGLKLESKSVSADLEINSGRNIEITGGVIHINGNIQSTGSIASYGATINDTINVSTTANIKNNIIGLNLSPYELLHLQNVTSDVQNQLDSKLDLNTGGYVDGNTTFFGDVSVQAPIDIDANCSIYGDLTVDPDKYVICHYDGGNFKSFKWEDIVRRWTPYKTYSFSISQYDTSDPVVTELQNDFGTTSFTWTRISAGVYRLDADATIFVFGKTISPQSYRYFWDSRGDNSVITISRSNSTQVELRSYSQGASAADELLNDIYVEIRVYD